MNFRTLIAAGTLTAITVGSFAYAQSAETPLLSEEEAVMEQPLITPIAAEASEDRRGGKRDGKDCDRDHDDDDDYEDDDDDYEDDAAEGEGNEDDA